MFIKAKERHQVDVLTKKGNQVTYFVKASSVNEALKQASRIAKQHDPITVTLYDVNLNVISVQTWK
jgi:hypothetical protein